MSTYSDAAADPRWWRVSYLVVPLTLCVTGVGYVAVQIASGKTAIAPLVDGFLAVTVLGWLLFGPLVWGWGVLVGFFVWPPVFRKCVASKLSEPMAAALSAFFVALLGGVLPFGSLALPDLNSFAGLFFVPAVISALVGPFVAWYVFRVPRKVEG